MFTRGNSTPAPGNFPMICSAVNVSPDVAAEHNLISREHHFQDLVGGGAAPDGSAGQGTLPGYDANRDATATRNATRFYPIVSNCWLGLLSSWRAWRYRSASERLCCNAW